jgi:hypothetical protein
MVGLLYAGRWPGGDPPAWSAGEARPWPSRAQVAAERAGTADDRGGKASAGDPAPAPVPQAGTSRKRRRKRGNRG